MRVVTQKIVRPSRPAVVENVIEEIANEGFMSLVGQRVTLMCNSYFYTGKLVGVNHTCVKLEDAGIVYETGPLNDKRWADMQPLPGPWYVQVNAIESFGVLK